MVIEENIEVGVVNGGSNVDKVADYANSISLFIAEDPDITG